MQDNNGHDRQVQPQPVQVLQIRAAQMIDNVGGNDGDHPGGSVLKNIEEQRKKQIETHPPIQQQKRTERAVLLQLSAHEQLLIIRLLRPRQFQSFSGSFRLQPS
ncbi:hypothetical protein D3C73_975290 [compost metagenome]